MGKKREKKKDEDSESEPVVKMEPVDICQTRLERNGLPPNKYHISYLVILNPCLPDLCVILSARRMYA